MPLSEDTGNYLLWNALRSIESGLETGSRASKDANLQDGSADEPGASFVTLTRQGQLRGCIGSLQPRTSLVEDVIQNAYNAAFRDPRFPALGKDELDDLEIEISVLGKPKPLMVKSEAELADRLRPGVDGLILELGDRKATFLPSVWKSLADPGDFIQHLKVKAGIALDEWSDAMQVWHYTTQSFSSAVDSIRKQAPAGG